MASEHQYIDLAGSVVRVVDQHPIDERRSEWLDERVQLDRRAFVFCGLHAHMRLTEALVKEMFGRAIDTGKVAQLRSAFKTHLGMEDKFVRSDTAARSVAGRKCPSMDTSAGDLQSSRITMGCLKLKESSGRCGAAEIGS